MRSEKKIKSVSYAKWGYIFILPFFLTYAVFSVIPLVDTIRNSFYEYYYSGLKAIGPNWVGLANYMELLAADLPKYAWNTFVMWILGFVPQIVVALVLASWFTDARLKIRGKQFFKVVIPLSPCCSLPCSPTPALSITSCSTWELWGRPSGLWSLPSAPAPWWP